MIELEEKRSELRVGRGLACLRRWTDYRGKTAGRSKQRFYVRAILYGRHTPERFHTRCRAAYDPLAFTVEYGRR